MQPVSRLRHTLIALSVLARVLVAMSDETSHDVIIVGSGLSGLTAAYRIKQGNPHANIRVLEARSRHGGRVFSPEFNVTGNRKDWFNLGAEWFGIGQTDFVEMLRELNLDYYETYATGDVIEQNRYNGPFQRVPKLYYEEDPDDLDKLHKLAKEFDEAIHAIDLDSLSADKLAEYESMSLEDYLKERGWPKWCRDALNGYVEEDVDSDAKHLSFAFFVMYFQKIDTFNSFYDDVKENFRAHRVSGGSQRITDELVRKLGNSTVELNTAVTSISKSVDGLKVHCDNRRTYTSKTVIIAIPPVTIAKITFDPPLSDARMKMYSDFQPFNYRDIQVKAIVTYNTTFWRDQGLSGFAEAQGSYDRALRTKLPYFFCADTTSANGSPALVVFASVETENEEKQKLGIIAMLVKAFGSEAEQYVDYQQKVWSDEPYIRGCVATFEPNKFDYKLFQKLIRKPVGDIHFAGTETAEKNPLYMAGAINAGNRVASEVLAKI